MCTIYWPEKTARKVTKNWNWLFLIFQQLKITNINIGHKFKIVWNVRHIFLTRILQITDQKKVWMSQIVQIDLCRELGQYLMQFDSKGVMRLAGFYPGTFVYSCFLPKDWVFLLFARKCIFNTLCGFEAYVAHSW